MIMWTKQTTEIKFILELSLVPEILNSRTLIVQVEKSQDDHIRKVDDVAPVRVEPKKSSTSLIWQVNVPIRDDPPAVKVASAEGPEQETVTPKPPKLLSSSTLRENLWPQALPSCARVHLA